MASPENALNVENGYFLPGFSIDCVIFGFHEGELKILLNKFNIYRKWMLPGGFMKKNEDVNVAAHRILYERTGLNHIFLEQFHLFGNCNRNETEMLTGSYDGHSDDIRDHWLMQRFISLGYYAFVDFTRVAITPDETTETSAWFRIEDIPLLCHDHNLIIDMALKTVRMKLSYIPVGCELLPDKFLMSDLRVLYEALLGKQLDRRNFQRKVLASGFIKQLDVKYTEGAFKPAHLYSFDKKKYYETLKKQLPVGW